jgi:PKD repeat protein
MAGLPIHVNAMNTPGVNHLSDIRWDFGDPKGRFNTLPGFNAAHVYEQPGEYTITLTVDGVESKRTVTITVADVNFIARLEDAKSDCRNVLTVPVIERSSTYWPKIKNATIEGMAGGGTTIVYTGRQSNAGIISLPDECDNLLLRRLTFDSTIDQGATRAVGVYQQKASLAVIDCIALRLESFVKSESKSASGLLIQGCSAPLADGVSGYFAWVSCNDAVIVGNTVANVTREHVVRMGYYDRVLIASNEFSNLDRRPGDPGDLSKGCIVAQRGSHVWISGNRCHFGGIGVGPLGGRDGLSDAAGSVQWAVIEQNSVDGGNCIQVLNGSAHVVVRDNVVDRGAADLSGIEVDGFDATYNRTVEDLTVTGNRQIRTGGTAPAVWFKTPGAVGVNNNDNLIVTPADKAALAGKGAS